MRLYLDDCADANLLVTYLQNAGHQVATPRSDGTSGISDPDHLEHAARNGRTLITRNPRDFEALHAEWQAAGRAHAGILLVCEDNIKSKDMEPPDIVRAIGNLLASGLPITNEVHVLNHWR